MAQDQEFYGIDLGTTNSCIAIIDEEDSVRVISNMEGLQTTPSVVAYDENDEPYVGAAAKNNMANDPDRTISFIKREMSNENYHRQIGRLDLTPVDVSAEILKKLVNDANQKRRDEDGKDPINRVVITVPAYFGMAERARTAEAGKRAGLDVITLINEPTAAALSFGKKNKQNRTILVYDLGGGTFDVSILRIQNGIMDTLSTNGNHQLGGVDWDERIVNFVLSKEGINMTCEELRQKDMPTYGQMIIAAEEAKKILTTRDTTTLRYNFNGIKNTPLSREEFEDLTSDLMDMTGTLVDAAMEAAGNPKLDEVLIVGGSSRMPMVKAYVDKKFGMSSRLFEPDLAVAKGAALFAAQQEKGFTKGAPMIGNDKGSASYGIGSYVNDVYMVCNLIVMSDDLEVRKDSGANGFSTRSDGQTSVDLNFYENRVDDEHCDVEMATLLQSGSVSWGKPVPAGTPMHVITERGKDGIVHVHVEVAGAIGDFQIGIKGVNSK